jgi:hypothetical protein
MPPERSIGLAESRSAVMPCSARIYSKRPIFRIKGIRPEPTIICSVGTAMTTRADFVIHPELHVRGEPERGIRPAYETRRTIRTLDDAVRYVREHKSRDLADRKSVIHQLENASTREQMLDAINAFRAWLEAEDLLFPTD